MWYSGIGEESPLVRAGGVVSFILFFLIILVSGPLMAL